MHPPHQRHSERVEEQSDHGDDARDGSAEAAKASQEAGEEGNDVEEERHEVEDPAEAPHVVEVLGRGVPGHIADEVPGGEARIRRPRIAEGDGRDGRSAEVVVGAADVEEVPPRDRSRSGNAGRHGFEEIGVIQRRRAGDTAEDDKEHEEERETGKRHADPAEGEV